MSDDLLISWLKRSAVLRNELVTSEADFNNVFFSPLTGFLYSIKMIYKDYKEFVPIKCFRFRVSVLRLLNKITARNSAFNLKHKPIIKN